MRIAKWIVALVAWAVAAPALALAQEYGDKNVGREYARAHCAECHGVEQSKDDFSPNMNAPDFSVVANTPGITGRALEVWLQTSHPTMPDLIIPENMRDNLIAYIMSLKKAPRS